MHARIRRDASEPRKQPAAAPRLSIEISYSERMTSSIGTRAGIPGTDREEGGAREGAPNLSTERTFGLDLSGFRA